MSKIVSTMLGHNDSNLKRSLTLISGYAGVDEEMMVVIYSMHFLYICIALFVERFIKFICWFMVFFILENYFS